MNCIEPDIINSLNPHEGNSIIGLVKDTRLNYMDVRDFTFYLIDNGHLEQNAVFKNLIDSAPLDETNLDNEYISKHIQALELESLKYLEFIRIYFKELCEWFSIDPPFDSVALYERPDYAGEDGLYRLEGEKF